MNINISLPTMPTPTVLTQEDVWGKWENGRIVSNGKVVARGLERCPFFGDPVPYKSVTVKCTFLEMYEVIFWLQHVQGYNCINQLKRLNEREIVIRSDYMCW